MSRPESEETFGTQSSRFEFAPPRHFLLPALVLLLSEASSYGYRLVTELQKLRFGRVDRPGVYRALAQLERDGLVESWSEAPKAGAERRVYGLTVRGERTLRVWMGVVKEERDGLDRVLRRYQATRTAEALLANVEGGWAAAFGQDLSPVSPTSPALRQPSPTSDRRRRMAAARWAEQAPVRRRFALIPERSVLLIEVRSTAGPISFGAVGMTGFVEVEMAGGDIRTDVQPRAHLEVAAEALRSGNNLYDAELLRRIDARRFPMVSIDLQESTPIGAADRYRLQGEVTFHGLARHVEGTVLATSSDDGTLIVSGEQAFDIRDFDIASPTVLMLRIYPDVKVQLHVEAEPTP